MFGPLSRANKSAFRRTRRIVVVVVVLGILLGNVIYQVVHSSGASSRLATASYVAAISPIVTQSNGLVPLLLEIRRAPGDLGSTDKARVELYEYLGELLSGAKSASTQLSELGLSPPTKRSGALIATVLDDRFVASQGLYGAISLATGPDHSNVVSARVATLLAGVGSQLNASDSSYRSFVASLPASSGRGNLPASNWAHAGSWGATATTAWAHELTATPVLSARRVLSLVAISLNPPAVTISGIALPKSPASSASSSTSGGKSTTTTTSSTTTTVIATGPSGVAGPVAITTTTIPPTTTTTIPPTTTTLQIPPAGSVSNLPETKTIEVIAVVADAGNATVDGVVVQAELTSVGVVSLSPLSPASSVKKSIGPISPGSARYVELAPLGVRSGSSYLLTVAATPSVGQGATATIRITIG